MAIKPSTQSKQNMPVICKAKGKYVYDVNWNKYLDFTGSNLTTILGYRPTLPSVPNYPGVSDVEGELSDLLSSYTQTKHFRYFKNGHNAVDCAVRLSRMLLYGRPEIETSYLGYHGTSDSYTWTIDNINGVADQYTLGGTSQSEQICIEDLPKETDILVFESRYAEYAKNIKSKIYVCDCLKDGIMGLYGLNNDRLYDFMLYGKSIANGSPLAVMTGKDELMEKIDDIYYSTTFSCNPADMKEAIRTIKDFEKGKEKYFKLYNYALDKLPKWQTITDSKIKEFQREGILYNGYYNIMTCMTKKDIDKLGNMCKMLNIK